MIHHTYQHPLVATLTTRVNELRRFIQILIGPRQTVKSTAIRQALEHTAIPVHLALASLDFPVGTSCALNDFRRTTSSPGTRSAPF